MLRAPALYGVPPADLDADPLLQVGVAMGGGQELDTGWL
jgi:hypothetical protein